MPKDQCWICKESSSTYNKRPFIYYDCPRCGKYAIDLGSLSDKRLSNEREIANASGWVREHQHQDVIIDLARLESLKNLQTPGVNERAEKILWWLYDQSNLLGELVNIDVLNKGLWSICWAIDEKELKFIFGYIQDRHFFKKFGDGVNQFAVQISSEGYIYLDSIKKQRKSNIGFCVMSFSPELFPAWSKAIEPAIAEAGYQPLRIDEHPHNVGVVDQIKAKIRLAKFVVSDLTLHRPSVYYEAGFADGLGIDVIFTCRDDQFDHAHFDVKHNNIIKWSDKEYDAFKEKLRWRIEGTLGRGVR